MEKEISVDICSLVEIFVDKGNSGTVDGFKLIIVVCFVVAVVVLKTVTDDKYSVVLVQISLDVIDASIVEVVVDNGENVDICVLNCVIVNVVIDEITVVNSVDFTGVITVDDDLVVDNGKYEKLAVDDSLGLDAIVVRVEVAKKMNENIATKIIFNLPSNVVFVVTVVIVVIIDLATEDFRVDF